MTVQGDVLAELAANLPALITPILAKLRQSKDVDAKRQARADWFKLHAMASRSVMAARVLLGGVENTGSHERPMYEDAIVAVDVAVPDVMAAARKARLYWDADDDAESTKMRALVTAEVTKPKKRAKAKKRR